MQKPEENHELIIAAKKGDQKALTQLIELFSEPVHSFLYSMLGNNEYVEDLAQETFLKMLKAINKYESRAPFRAWLFRIAVNICRDHLRKKKVRKIVTYISHDDEQEIPIIDVDQNPHRNFENMESRIMLEKILNKIPPPLRTVFILRDIQDFTYEEISKTLNWNLGTVKSRLFRSRKEIAKYYNELQED